MESVCYWEETPARMEGWGTRMAGRVGEGGSTT